MLTLDTHCSTVHLYFLTREPTSGVRLSNLFSYLFNVALRTGQEEISAEEFQPVLTCYAIAFYLSLSQRSERYSGASGGIMKPVGSFKRSIPW
jgi:hypothetical protein